MRARTSHSESRRAQSLRPTPLALDSQSSQRATLLRTDAHRLSVLMNRCISSLFARHHTNAVLRMFQNRLPWWRSLWGSSSFASNVSSRNRLRRFLKPVPCIQFVHSARHSETLPDTAREQKTVDIAAPLFLAALRKICILGDCSVRMLSQLHCGTTRTTLGFQRSLRHHPSEPAEGPLRRVPSGPAGSRTPSVDPELSR